MAGSKKQVFYSLLLFFCIGCVVGIIVAMVIKIPKTAPEASAITIAENANASEIVEAYSTAVVTVKVCKRTFSDYTISSFGSGVSVKKAGYFITNYHVVSEAIVDSTLKTFVYSADTDTDYTAIVIWYNADLDVAILYSSTATSVIPFAEMKDRVVACEETEKLKVMEEVIAIGTPVDTSLVNTATHGYVNALNRVSSSEENDAYEHLIQHQAFINHGNSGGPLIDMNGYVVGLNTLGLEETASGEVVQGIFFAVPVYPIMLCIDKVIEKNENSSVYKTPVIGIVSAVDRNEDNSFDESGFKVVNVSTTGPARSILLSGDVITTIVIGETTYNIDIRNDYIYCMLRCSQGDVVTLYYKRGLVTYHSDITLA